MKHYFDWYNIDNKHRVKFARMKLQGSPKIYWMSIERQRAKKDRKYG